MLLAAVHRARWVWVVVQRVLLPAQPRVLRERLARVEAQHRVVRHKVARQLKGEPQHKAAARTRAVARTPALQRRRVVKLHRPRRVAHKRHRRGLVPGRPHRLKVLVRVVDKVVAMVPRLMAPVAARRPTRHRMTVPSLRPEGLRISIVPLR